MRRNSKGEKEKISEVEDEWKKRTREEMEEEERWRKRMREEEDRCRMKMREEEESCRKKLREEEEGCRKKLREEEESSRKKSMKMMKLPQSLAELRASLGLANQFRDRVPGYALLVANLTALTRVNRGTSKSFKLKMTTEAIIEFENLKAALASPTVLQQFHYDRKTIVYTDASVGTQDGTVAGGLGVVVIQEDPSDGRAYLCAFDIRRGEIEVRMEEGNGVGGMKKLLDANTWELTTLPQGKKPIPCKRVYSPKQGTMASNTEEWLESARLVARGDLQQAGEDYGETHAPVVYLVLLRMLLTLAAIIDTDYIIGMLWLRFLMGN